MKVLTRKRPLWSIGAPAVVAIIASGCDEAAIKANQQQVAMQQARIDKMQKEIAGGEPAQVQNRQHLGDLGQTTHVGRQDMAGETPELPIVVAPAVVDPWRFAVSGMQARPASFYAIGQFYGDFHQCTDDEVIRLLESSSVERQAPSMHT